MKHNTAWRSYLKSSCQEKEKKTFSQTQLNTLIAGRTRLAKSDTSSGRNTGLH